MNDERLIRRKHGVTPKGMLLGGLVGAVLGALLRGGITYYHLRGAEVFGLLASLPSAGIGLLCGAIAGCSCRAWVGALVGAVLSAGMFSLFVLPGAYVFAQFNAVEHVAEFTWRLFAQKAVAGGIAGGAGGLLGRWMVASEAARRMAYSQPENA